MSDNKNRFGGLKNLGKQIGKRVQNTAQNFAESEEGRRLAQLASEKAREVADKASEVIIAQTGRFRSALAQIDTTEFRGRVDANVVQFRSRFQQETYEGKPAILVIGRTGAGKSTLINTIIGREAAPTGSGEPITQEFNLYSAEDLPVELYDSPGWEGGKEKADAFLKDTRTLLKDNPQKIQTVWYVIDAQSTRLVDFEIDLLQNVLNTKPVCLLLTKCDIATDEQIIGILRAIISTKIPSQVGAYEIAARPLQPLDDDLQERFDYHLALEQSYYIMGINDQESAS